MQSLREKTVVRVSHRPRSQRGFSLIEVVVTMFVLVVGLLGLVAMQLNVTQSNHESYIRSQAMVIAQSLADRIRLNSQYINRNDFTSPPRLSTTDNEYSTTANYNFGSLSGCSSEPWSCYCQAIPSAIPSCRSEGGTAASDCSADQMAVYDAWEASCSGVAVHPEFHIQVSCQDSNTSDSDSCSPHSTHTILLSWPAASSLVSARSSCPNDIELGLASSGSSNVERSCVVLPISLGGTR